MVGAPVAAGPDPDSAAGTCVGGDKAGLGDRIGKEFIPNLKEYARIDITNLDEAIQSYNAMPNQGFAIPAVCAPKKGQDPAYGLQDLERIEGPVPRRDGPLDTL